MWGEVRIFLLLQVIHIVTTALYMVKLRGGFRTQGSNIVTWNSIIQLQDFLTVVAVLTAKHDCGSLETLRQAIRR